MMLVERNRAVILGIDDDSERGNAGFTRAINRVKDKHAPELTPLKVSIDR